MFVGIKVNGGMITVTNLSDLKGIALTATIGFFDGVHLGHRFLIEQVKQEAAKQQQASAVITFRQHPRQVLHSDYQPKLLTGYEEKIALLAETGIDYCIVLDFSLEISRLTAQEFIEQVLRDQLYVSTLLIGYDHRFGHNRSEGFEDYVRYGAAVGMTILQALQYDNGHTHVSSSEIRRLLQLGDVATASTLLTYPYHLKGSVVKGFQIGRKIGFPTANLHIDEPYKIIPAIGIYAAWAVIDRAIYKAMVYIGNRPTVHDNTQTSIEANIIDFDRDLYNKEHTILFVDFVRGNAKFDGLEALKRQISLDKVAISSILDDTSLPLDL